MPRSAAGEVAQYGSTSASGERFEHAYCQLPLFGAYRLASDSRQILKNNIAPGDTIPRYPIRAGKMYHMDVPGSVGTGHRDDAPVWSVRKGR